MMRLQVVLRICLAGLVVLGGLGSAVEAGCRRGGGHASRWGWFGPPPLARLLMSGYGHGGYASRRQPPSAHGRKRSAGEQPATQQQAQDAPEAGAELEPVAAAASPGSSTETDVAQGEAVPADAPEASPQSLLPGLDVALVDVRLVNAGDAASGVGPVYRISLRNAGTVDIDRPIQLAVLAGNAGGSGTTAPVTAEVPGLAPGAMASVDVELDASLAGTPLAGRRLYVVADSLQQLEETDEANNLADLAMDQIEPAQALSLRLSANDVAPGSELRIEGSGFGELPGRVVLEVGGVKLLAEIVSWSDSLVCVRLPSVVLDGPTTALLTVVPPNDPPRGGMELRLAGR